MKVMLMRLGYINRVERIYRQAIVLNQANFYAYFSLARVIQINKNYDEAIEMYKKCIQLGNFSIIYFNLAACYEENLQFKKAVKFNSDLKTFLDYKRRL
jgi:tetratricopeptide (TPR) repeat protein